MTTKKVDFIIVGQGLAGSCLALQLLFRKKRVLIIDRIRGNSATRVAAGLFNPITGRQMMKTWMADTLFPYLHSFYREAEKFLQSNFFFPMPLYRPFVSVEEQNEWMGRSEDPMFSNFIESLHTDSVFDHQVKNPFGGLLLKQCGYIDTQLFLTALRKQLQRIDSLLDEDINEQHLEITPQVIRYKEWQAEKIIYCTGASNTSNSFFSWLPIRPLKGETLALETTEPVEIIYNRGIYVVPNLWKAGATYTREETPHVTEEGRLELMQKLDELVAFNYNIIGQQWGFRPTTPDRRPILGSHPVHEQIAIFNGLGTKGVSLAPYFSEELVHWLENGTPLNQLVDINRYKSLFSKST
ncbi:MAG: FAD-binding oxidoreductase [Cyclobacteriaceae bacterium]|nr:FAD-binding oxidoreductase [Cyclobacteriaceae bacterium]